MEKELKCLKCKWYMNDRLFKELYPNDTENWFKHTCCGCGSDYYCVVSGYSLFESKE
jgi:hypothetical protein